MAHAHHRRIALLLPLALTGFPVTTFQADSLPPLSTYAPGSPERVWLQSIHLHRKRDWKALAALYGSEWHRLYPGGTDADDPEDPRFSARLTGCDRSVWDRSPVSNCPTESYGSLPPLRTREQARLQPLSRKGSGGLLTTTVVSIPRKENGS